jgi:hypothetical protein
MRWHNAAFINSQLKARKRKSLSLNETIIKLSEIIKKISLNETMKALS